MPTTYPNPFFGSKSKKPVLSADLDSALEEIADSIEAIEEVIDPENEVVSAVVSPRTGTRSALLALDGKVGELSNSNDISDGSIIKHYGVSGLAKEFFNRYRVCASPFYQHTIGGVTRTENGVLSGTVASLFSGNAINLSAISTPIQTLTIEDIVPANTTLTIFGVETPVIHGAGEDEELISYNQYQFFSVNIGEISPTNAKVLVVSTTNAVSFEITQAGVYTFAVVPLAVDQSPLLLHIGTALYV